MSKEFSTYKILVVEDDIRIANDFGDLLRKDLKCLVDLAFDGAEALRCVDNQTPDLIVLDVRLPILNGFRVLEELKRRGVTTRVIMASGEYVDVATAVRAIKAGACDFLIKPILPQELVASVKRTLVLESTINLSILEAQPPLVSQLIELLEKRPAGRPSASEQPHSEIEPQSFREKVSRHWLVGLIVIVVMVCGVVWQLCQILYVAPRDFEISRLREQKVAAEKAAAVETPPKGAE